MTERRSFVAFNMFAALAWNCRAVSAYLPPVAQLGLGQGSWTLFILPMDSAFLSGIEFSIESASPAELCYGNIRKIRCCNLVRRRRAIIKHGRHWWIRTTLCPFLLSRTGQETSKWRSPYSPSLSGLSKLICRRDAEIRIARLSHSGSQERKGVYTPAFTVPTRPQLPVKCLPVRWKNQPDPVGILLRLIYHHTGYTIMEGTSAFQFILQSRFYGVIIAHFSSCYKLPWVDEIKWRCFAATTFDGFFCMRRWEQICSSLVL